MTPIQLKLLNPDFYEQFCTPAYATTGAAAVDLRACVTSRIGVLPGDAILVPTGLAIHIEDPNLCALILPRSGLGHNYGLVLGNGTGLIDSDYQGEIMVSACNRGYDPIYISPGDRIAQMLFVPVTRVRFDIVEEFTPTDRATGGFGSTGTR